MPSRKILRYGVSAGNDYRAEAILVETKGTRFRCAKRCFRIETWARHQVLNALAAVVCARELGVPWTGIRDGLAKAEFPPGRQTPRVIQGRWIIDDTYNANPLSLAAALTTLSAFPSSGRRFVVCGDMAELGSGDVAWHRRAGRMIAESSADLVLTMGPSARWISQEASRRGCASRHYQRLRALALRLKKETRPGDVILIKGSRRMRLERLLLYLEELF